MCVYIARDLSARVTKTEKENKCNNRRGKMKRGRNRAFFRLKKTKPTVPTSPTIESLDPTTRTNLNGRRVKQPSCPEQCGSVKLYPIRFKTFKNIVSADSGQRRFVFHLLSFSRCQTKSTIICTVNHLSTIHCDPPRSELIVLHFSSDVLISSHIFNVVLGLMVS